MCQAGLSSGVLDRPFPSGFDSQIFLPEALDVSFLQLCWISLFLPICHIRLSSSTTKYHYPPPFLNRSILHSCKASLSSAHAKHRLDRSPPCKLLPTPPSKLLPNPPPKLLPTPPPKLLPTPPPKLLPTPPSKLLPTPPPKLLPTLLLNFSQLLLLNSSQVLLLLLPTL
jgi:hypothetical protein